tara:strand:- start:881 stop:1219 length:339 start_codon:yes stop_codon:yes gene_type:complete
MAEMINVKVDVSKLDKDRFFKGKKGTYCDLVLIPTPSSDFGTWGIVQKSTKEERDSGTKMPFVGNADVAGSQQKNSDSGSQQNFSGSQASQRPMTSTISATAEDLQGDDIPF